MGEFKRPKSKEEYYQNFSPLKPLMNPTMAYYESARCLFCYDAPCITACPTEIDIPLFIRQINNGNLKGAAKTIYDSNYFGFVCGQVCPTEVLCEGACVYNEQDVKPIEIGRLQSYATQNAIHNGHYFYTNGEDNGKKVAVIGAGPAGISCACELRKLGYHVDIFEAKAHPSGLIIHGNAPYKISNDEVWKEIKYLDDQFEFSIHYEHPIVSKEQFQKLEKDYDAIFLGIGLGKTQNARIPGENLKNCTRATTYIEDIKMDPLNASVGNHVVVIGGGNTAMDAVSESARMGASKVTLAYRRSKSEMRAYHFEYDLAKNAGVDAMFNVQPVEVVGTDQVEGVRLIKTTMKNGILQPIEGAYILIECDMVVFATGQHKMIELFDLIGLQFNEYGHLYVEEDTYQCSNPKYFAAGDAINGGAEVVNACGEAKQAALDIHNYLS